MLYTLMVDHNEFAPLLQTFLNYSVFIFSTYVHTVLSIRCYLLKAAPIYLETF